MSDRSDTAPAKRAPYRPSDEAAALGYDRWRQVRLHGPLTLSVVIPAYNERVRIVPTVGAIAAYLSGVEESWELILADDGSTDGTPDIVESLGLPNVRVLRAERNMGKGAAVRRGLQAARGEYVLFTDADMSTPIESIDDLLDACEVGADVAVGSRAAEGATETGKSGMRHLISGVLRAIQTIVVPTGVKDTQCGFKLFRRDAAHRLTAVQRIDGFAFDLELLHAAHRLGMEVVERPVEWVDAPGSKVRPIRDTKRFFESMAQIRWGWATKHRRSRGQEGKVQDRLDLVLISRHEPARDAIAEYGTHLLEALAGRPEIGHVTLLHEELDGTPNVPCGVDAARGWRSGSLTTPIRLARSARRARPDAVLLSLQYSTFGETSVARIVGLATPLLLRLLGITTIVILHDSVEPGEAAERSGRHVSRIRRATAKLTARLVLLADRVVVFAPSLATSLKTNFNTHNVHLVPHGVFDTRADVAFIPSDPARPTIMEFGRFGTYKRCEPLIEAFRMLQDGGLEGARLVIAGSDAPEATGYLQSVQDGLPFLDDIEFTGFVKDEDVPDLFRSASVVVFSWAPGASSSPLHQAAAYGRAIVLPDVPELAGIVDEEGFAAETYVPGDPVTLSRAIGRLAADPERRRRAEEQNAAASQAQRLSRIAGWYVLHTLDLLESRPGSRLQAARERIKQGNVLRLGAAHTEH